MSSDNGGEGASENSLVRLADNKTIMMVVRYAGGDGGLWQSPQCGTCGPITISKMPQCRDQCYKNYRRFLSKDEGRHWSGPFELPNTGSCRPRLLMMGGGKGPLILSGGRSVNRGRYDVSMWVNWDGMGATWEEHSLSYVHNERISDPLFQFGASVNTTEDTYSYTSLLPIDDASFVVTYDKRGPNKTAAFAMRVTVE